MVCRTLAQNRARPPTSPGSKRLGPPTHPTAACTERIVSLVSTAIMQAKKICQPSDCGAAPGGEGTANISGE